MSTFSLSSVYAQLTSFANLSNFWSLFDTAFGSSYDSAKSATFQYQWQSQDFSQFPQIEIVSRDVLGGTKGAYGISTNRIYLSDQFVSVASQQSLEAVILEEFGHFVDAQVNQVDSAGDEGAIFAELVQNNSLDVATLDALRAENDQTTIMINGEIIQVEQSNFTGTNGDDSITGTSGDDNISGLDGNDTLSGLGEMTLLSAVMGVISSTVVMAPMTTAFEVTSQMILRLSRVTIPMPTMEPQVVTGL